MNNSSIINVSAVLVAAGNGKRMLGISKQLYPIEGKPVIAYTIENFLECTDITEIILVCRHEEAHEMAKIADETINGRLPYKIVVGAETRQSSVFCGVSAANDNATHFAIHDGVRPLTKPEEIQKCIEAAVKLGAAALGVPVKDTIKITNAHGFIESTPKREQLFAIQTPQVFEAKLYRAAMENAVSENKEYTDDCQLIENMGKKVAVCEGSYENIKITTREDVYIAKAILDYRREGL